MESIDLNQQPVSLTKSQEIRPIYLIIIRISLFIGGLLMGIMAGFLLWNILHLAGNQDLYVGAPKYLPNLFLLSIMVSYLMVMAFGACQCAVNDDKEIYLTFNGFIMINILVCLLVMMSLPGYKQLETKFNLTLVEAQRQYSFDGVCKNGDIDSSTLFWDKLQEKEHCCGFKEPSDWFPYFDKLYKKYNNGSSAYPRSCCNKPKRLENNSTVSICENLDEYHKEGCLDAIFAPIGKILLLFAGVMITSFILAALATISAFKSMALGFPHFE